MHPPTGRELLALALSDRGLSQQALEESLSLSAGIVSRWLSGKRKPSLATAVMLDRELGIPATSWLDSAA